MRTGSRGLYGPGEPGASIATGNVAMADWSVESVTVKVTVWVPPTVGVPEIAPLDPLNESPVGSVPPVIVHA
jgi:hypothetical protein